MKQWKKSENSTTIREDPAPEYDKFDHMDNNQKIEKKNPGGSLIIRDYLVLECDEGIDGMFPNKRYQFLYGDGNAESSWVQSGDHFSNVEYLHTCCSRDRTITKGFENLGYDQVNWNTEYYGVFRSLANIEKYLCNIVAIISDFDIFEESAIG